MSMDLTIEKQQNGEALTLKLEGRLSMTTAPLLENAVNEISAETKDLVLDFNELTYISSAGLRVILMAQKKMNKVGTMKLIGVCDAVMDIFEITGFADVLVIE